jgi:hypothetical protein
LVGRNTQEDELDPYPVSKPDVFSCHNPQTFALSNLCGGRLPFGWLPDDGPAVEHRLNGIPNCSTSLGLGEPTPVLFDSVYSPNLTAFGRGPALLALDLQRVPAVEQVDTTVAMAVYNRAMALRYSIPKLLSMTTGVWELVVVLDACLDASFQEVATALQRQMANSSCVRARVVVQPTAVWETSSNNIALRMTSPSKAYVLLQPDMIVTERGWNERLMLPLSQVKNAFAVSGRCGHSFDDYNQIGRCGKDFGKPPKDSRESFHVRNTVIRGPLLLHAKRLQELGFLDEVHNYLGLDDHDLMWRATKKKFVAGYLSIGVVAPMGFGTTNTKQLVPEAVAHAESLYKNSRNIEVREARDSRIGGRGRGECYKKKCRDKRYCHVCSFAKRTTQKIVIKAGTEACGRGLMEVEEQAYQRNNTEAGKS